MSQHEAILLLGSNEGDIQKNVQTALDLIEDSGCTIVKKSNFLITKPVEFVSSNFFCNIAISINMQFSPLRLLENMKQIEMTMGRIHDSSVFGHYVDRVIDIDIVSFNKLTFVSRKLQIPHQKHLFERDFSRELIINLGK